MDRETNIGSIRALEKQIKEHEDAIIKLKRARNSFLNISSLPPEVLGNIFRWNTTVEEPFDNMTEDSYNFLLVSHHWFEVASRTPELWTFWGNNFQDWGKRYLRSSVATPLDLVLDGTIHLFGCVSEPQQIALKERATRDTIRRIHLRTDMHCHLTSIISPLLSPRGGLLTSSLESLILSSEYETALDVSFLARSSLPKLQHLELGNCIVSSWDNLMSQTTLLTTLELSFNEASPAPTTPRFLSILVHNLHLQRLKLNAWAIPTDDGDGPCEVSLHHLTELELGGSVGQVFRLLSRLEYPQRMNTLSLRLSHCQSTDVSQTIGPYLRDYIQRHGRSRNGLGLHISPGSSIVFGVGAPQRLRLSSSMGPRMNFFVTLTLRLDQAPVDLQEKFTSDLITYIPRGNVVYFRTHESLGAVRDLRVQLPNLKTLDLYRVPLSAVFPMPDRGPSDGQERFPPSLHNIFLERPFLGEFNWLPLIAYLSRRKSSGNQLGSLFIDGPCHMCRTMTYGVKALVREFEIVEECLQSWCPIDACL